MQRGNERGRHSPAAAMRAALRGAQRGLWRAPGSQAGRRGIASRGGGVRWAAGGGAWTRRRGRPPRRGTRVARPARGARPVAGRQRRMAGERAGRRRRARCRQQRMPRRGRCRQQQMPRPLAGCRRGGRRPPAPSRAASSPWPPCAAFRARRTHCGSGGTRRPAPPGCWSRRRCGGAPRLGEGQGMGGEPGWDSRARWAGCVCVSSSPVEWDPSTLACDVGDRPPGITAPQSGVTAAHQCGMRLSDSPMCASHAPPAASMCDGAQGGHVSDAPQWQAMCD